MKQHKTPAKGNIFQDIGLEDAEILKKRAELLVVLKKYIETSPLNQNDLAKSLNTRRPVISAAINNRPEECSIERLIKVIIAAGGKVSLSASIPKPSDHKAK